MIFFFITQHTHDIKFKKLSLSTIFFVLLNNFSSKMYGENGITQHLFMKNISSVNNTKTPFLYLSWLSIYFLFFKIQSIKDKTWK